MSGADRPGADELFSFSRQAVNNDRAQEPLVSSVLEFLLIVEPFVRAGRSAPSMCNAFDNGVAALKQAAEPPS